MTLCRCSLRRTLLNSPLLPTCIHHIGRRVQIDTRHPQLLKSLRLITFFLDYFRRKIPTKDIHLYTNRIIKITPKRRSNTVKPKGLTIAIFKPTKVIQKPTSERQETHNTFIVFDEEPETRAAHIVTQYYHIPSYY